MPGPSENSCPQCGATRRSDESLCPQCLLSAAGGGDSHADEDRIFQQSLAVEPEERLAFIDQATRGNPPLGAAVRMLLQGYLEAGGDVVLPTQGAAPTARAQWAEPPPEVPGTVIGHFRLVRLLGEGGMGSVWQAEQTAPVRRTVALKLIKLGMDTREVVRRFERERQTLAFLNHPNIAQVFEAGATALGRPFFAMEFVAGQPVTTYGDAAGLDVEARLRLFRDVCSAVEHAHQKGVIHRDLKPSNILVADGVVKVIDFGVAKATQGLADPLFTQPAQILGTPAYMSPEQARSAGADVDTRTDVYALGVVLYEILTGALPIDPARFAGTTLAGMHQILMETEPPTPSDRVAARRVQGRSANPDPRPRSAPRGELDWVVMKAIRKDREERYAGAAALSEDLRRFLAGEPVAAAPLTLGYLFEKFVRRHRSAVVAALVVTGALVAGTVVSAWQAVRAVRAQRETTLTVADMHTRSGLAAAGHGEASWAALWMANAAVIARDDPQRVEANRRRAAAWRQEIMPPVRARETGFDYVGQMSWNPRLPALIVCAQSAVGALVWDLERDQLWDPGFEPPLERAIWDAAGERIATLTGSKIIIREFPSGRELARSEVGSASVMAFSPDGRWLAVGANPAFLWDWRIDERVALASQDQHLADLQFSADGRSLLQRWDQSVGLCGLANPMVFLHPPVPCAVRAAAGLLAEGDRYFTGGTNASVQVRDVLSGIVLEEYPAGDPTWGLPLAATPDGRFIAREYAPVIDRLASAPAAFPTHKNIFDSSSFSPDGAWMASGSYDDTLKLWDLASGRFLGQVGHHQRAVLSLAFSPEGTLLASSQEGLVRLWRVARPPAGRVIPTGATSLARLSTDGLLLAPSGYTRRQGALTRTRAVELATGKAVGPELVPGGVIMDAAFSPDGAWLALIASTTMDRLNAPFGTQGGSGNLQWWNHLTGERVGEPIPLPSEPRGVAVHPSGRWVGVYCGAGEGVEVEVSTRQVRRLFDHRRQSRPEATLNNGRCAYSPDGRLFVAWGLEDLTHFWDRDAGRELIEPVLSGGNSFDVAFSGNTVANVVVARTNRVEFRDIRTGQDVVAPIPHAGWPFLGRFSADGGLLLTTGRDRVGRVWDWRRGRLICPALPHEDEVMAGAFVPGRPWVVTGGHDGLIQCWDYRTGMPVCPPLRRDGWVLELHVTADGATLVAGGLTAGGIEVFDFASLTPEPDLPPESARLLAEIEASAEVHPGGDLVPLSAEDWLRRWQLFRQRHPDFAGHRLEMDPAARRAWHEARARELESTLPTAAPWHRRRLE